MATRQHATAPPAIQQPPPDRPHAARPVPEPPSPVEPAPKPRFKEGLHVSVSAIKQYLRCPRQFHYERVQGLEVPDAVTPVALVLGGAFHEALAALYGRIKEQGELLDLEATLATFREVFGAAVASPETVDLSGSTAEAWSDLGSRMVIAFHAQLAQMSVPHVLAVEEPFTIELHHPETGELLEESLIGVFDAVIADDAGAPIVLEHKTAARRWSEDQLDSDIQASGYAVAARQLGLGDEITVQYQIVTKTKDPAVQIVPLRIGARDQADFLHIAVGVLRAIDAGAFYPVRGWWCSSCPYTGPCMGTAGEAAK